MMLAARGAFLAARRKPKLPYDAEVEYLKSTGTQWINTLVYPDLSSAKIEIQAVKATGYTLFGANSYMRCTGNGGYNVNYAYYNQLQFAIYTPTDISSPHVFILDKNEFYVDGELKGTATISSRVSSFPICLYGYSTNTQGTATSDRGSHTIYYCKIYNNGVLVRDLIPVRVGSGASAVGYMYDRVTRRLFGNAGTGAFTIGPDKAA